MLNKKFKKGELRKRNTMPYDDIIKKWYELDRDIKYMRSVDYRESLSAHEKMILDKLADIKNLLALIINYTTEKA